MILFTRYITDKNSLKQQPVHTICPMSGFKQKGFHHKLEDAVKNSFNLSEIIYNDDFNDTKSLLYKELIAQQIGRCFSIYNSTGFKLYNGLVLFFEPNHDLKIYIHPRGDELWLAGFQEFPYEVATVSLDIAKLQNFSLAMITLREVRSVYQTKEEMPCKDYSSGPDHNNEHDLFSKCSRESLWKNLPKTLTCKIADMEQFMPFNFTIRECSTVKEAETVYWEFIRYLEKFISMSWEYGCPVPCRQTSYQVKLDYFHKSSALIPPELANYSMGRFSMHSSFPTFTVEEKIESLEYDLASLLVSAGGNLGLFLGFSCLSVMFAAIQWLHSKYAE